MLRSNRSKLLARIAFIALLIAATAVFFIQVPSTAPRSIPFVDKYIHFGVFFLLSLTLHQAFAISGRLSFVLLGIYGLLIEMGQSYVPGRGSDVYDWIADSLGVLTYFTVVFIVNQRKKR